MATMVRAERILLKVGDQAAGFAHRFRGLDVEAEIATGGLGAGRMPKKHVANVRWTPGVAAVSSDMGSGLHAWIAEALENGWATRSGSVAGLDPAGAASWSLAYSGARLSAVTFPALDASSKDTALMTVEFAPREVRWDEGGGAAVPPLQKSEPWLNGIFRVEIGDLPGKRVLRVDPFTWSCAADGTVAVSDVRLVISHADLGPWQEAARRWFIDGHHRDVDEMAGRIVILSPTLKEDLATIELGNVGLRRFSREDADGDAVGSFAVVLYAEKLRFKMAT
jgi:hypothetical protein